MAESGERVGGRGEEDNIGGEEGRKGEGGRRRRRVDLGKRMTWDEEGGWRGEGVHVEMTA